MVNPEMEVHEVVEDMKHDLILSKVEKIESKLEEFSRTQAITNVKEKANHEKILETIKRNNTLVLVTVGVIGGFLGSCAIANTVKKYSEPTNIRDVSTSIVADSPEISLDEMTINSQLSEYVDKRFSEYLDRDKVFRAEYNKWQDYVNGELKEIKSKFVPKTMTQIRGNMNSSLLPGETGARVLQVLKP